MSRFRMVVGEALRSLRATMSTTVAASMTVLIAMFVLGTTIALGTWLLSYSDHIKKQLAGHGLLQHRAAGDARADQRDHAEFDPKREPARQEDHLRLEGAGAQGAEEEVPGADAGAPVQPVPGRVRIQPKKAESISTTSERSCARSRRASTRSSDGGNTSKRVLKVGGILSVVFLVGVIMLLIASTLLIANTIRLSIFSRRREIEVMKLVGATNWFVRGPFMIEGLLCGLGGSLAAVILLVIGKAALLPSIGIGHSKDAHAMAFELNALILIGLGLMLGVFGTGLTLRRFLQV